MEVELDQERQAELCLGETLSCNPSLAVARGYGGCLQNGTRLFGSAESSTSKTKQTSDKECQS